MVYNILYIEDLVSDSRKSDLEKFGFKVHEFQPTTDLNSLLDFLNSNEIHIILMDYRLGKGENAVPYDAPTLASTLRTKQNKKDQEKPIILISNENLIADFYKDFLNHDLFDYAVDKTSFSSSIELYGKRLISYYNSYEIILKNNFNLHAILDIVGKEHLVPNSFIKHIENKSIMLNSVTNQLEKVEEGLVYEYSRIINDTVIYSIGMLIGEDVLSARLGVSKESNEWEALKSILEFSKYKGIFSDTHNRWWALEIENWFKSISNGKSLRSLTSTERIEIIREHLKLDLKELDLPKFCNSKKFWTICKGSKVQIDPFEGISIKKKTYYDWQEKELFSREYALVCIENVKHIIEDKNVAFLKNMIKR
jgi:hypothetical protein